ncbi:MAG: hypothetical protein ACLVL7_04895 [Anaerotruncus massiliensis (ex Togo et al. 2019)]
MAEPARGGPGASRSSPRPAQPAFGPRRSSCAPNRRHPAGCRGNGLPDIPTVRTRRVETKPRSDHLNRAVNASRGVPGPDGRALTKAVEEALAHLDLRKLSDRVYRDLESRLRSEKARRGQW